MPKAFDFGSLAQRTDHIGQRMSGLKRIDQASRLTDPLNNDRYHAGVGVRLGHGQRYAFAVLVGAYNNELTGPMFAGNARSLDAQPLDL